MSYTSQNRIEAHLGRALTASESVMLTDILPAVDTVINELIGAEYDNATATLYFDGGSSIVDLPGMTDITSVNYYDPNTDTLSPIDSSSYTAYPLNSSRKFYLRMRNGRFTDGVSNIAVVGNTGDAPSEVVLAATIMASDFLTTSNASGALTEERIGDWTKKYASGSDSSDGTRLKVLQLLAPYRDIMI